jgi:hypothetical protein
MSERRKGLIAVLLSLPLGGIFGLAFGFAARGRPAPLFPVSGYSGYLDSGDALFWVLAGMVASAPVDWHHRSVAT